MVLKSSRRRIAISMFLLVVFLFALVLNTTSSYTIAPRFQGDDLTPWAYIPIVIKAPAPADVRITFVENHDPGYYFPVHREYVLIQNLGGTGQNMDGWQIADQAQGGLTFTFPGSLSTFTLEPGASVKVWTRYGDDTTEEMFWNYYKAIWDDDGDTVYLRDNTGTLVDTYTY